MTPEEAHARVVRAACDFGAGTADIRHMWNELHGSLHDLCRDEPMNGLILDLFNALEAWEGSVGNARGVELEKARAIANALSGRA